MKRTLFTVAALFIAVVVANLHDDSDSLNVQILDSKVPNVDYELQAVESLYEAYALYPENQEKRLKAFALLFNDTHPTSGGWKVSEGCTGFFNPSEHYYINLNVTANGAEEVVKLFD